MRPLLSILIPTRNRSHYLKYAVESALAISDADIEVIASNNMSDDDTLQVLKNFSDQRLRFFSTESVIPMHSNFELLLKEARGDWIYFLGDDDAMMPYAADHIRRLSEKYPACEAVVSARALYFWKGCMESNPPFVLSVGLSAEEEWVDSKKLLSNLLNATQHYFVAPQHYSGGVHRRSLINRVLRSQNGVFYKSVTPDAYSAVMGCLHTSRFLRTGLPLAWIGTSDTKQSKTKKDRNNDFYGLISDEQLGIHMAVGSLKPFTLPLVFYEAYLSAIPTASASELNHRRITLMAADAVHTFLKNGLVAELNTLLSYFDVTPSEMAVARMRLKLLKRFDFLQYKIKRLPNRLRRLNKQHILNWRPSLLSKSYEDFSHINVANNWAMERYHEYRELPTRKLI